jgi:hypothetical protein
MHLKYNYIQTEVFLVALMSQQSAWYTSEACTAGANTTRYAQHSI